MFKVLVLLMIPLVSLTGVFQTVEADCNDAGWDPDCLDECDSGYADCMSQAWDWYWQCVNSPFQLEWICQMYFNAHTSQCRSWYNLCQDRCQC